MQSSSRKGRILFIPMPTQGHTNYCIPLANRFLELYGDENEVFFALNEEFKNKLEKKIPKAKFVVYANPQEENHTKHWLVEVMQIFGETWSSDTISYVKSSTSILETYMDGLNTLYPILSSVVDQVKPDFIIFDQLFSCPIGKDKNIKWANLFSAAINYVGYSLYPPPQSGLPTEYTAENVKKWNEFVEVAYKSGPFYELKQKCSEHLKQHGLPGLDDYYFVYEFSPYLNIYGYPKELDYQEEPNRKLPGNWLRIESPVTPPYSAPFPVPDKLKNLPGKLIYFSLGSMANAYKPLMTKMLNILEQLPHKFIISKGLIGDEYEMKANMYGENYVDQFAVLQTVEMVISHGGNNTLTETFYFGKPLIFVPLFGDQIDNAQRMDDKGLGKRCDIFDPPAKLKKDLEDAIEYCSRDSVKLKLKLASERIQKDTGLDRVCEELLRLIKK